MIFSIRSISAFSQKEVQEKLFSSNLQDTVHYNVFLPLNSEAENGMPTIYAIKYGMIEGSYIAAQLRYFQDANYPIPKTIVVTIRADMDRTGFSYRTGGLTNTGSKFIACLKEEIIPAVEKKYHTAKFRTYLGHSYSASYATYMMQHEPELFRGYILLATEQVGVDYSLQTSSREKTSQPLFQLNKDDTNFYNSTTTFCYAATGVYDENRRKNYAQELIRNFNSLDSSHFISTYDSIPGGNHTNILTTAIQPALEFIYKLYDPAYGYEQGNEHNAWDLFAKAKKRTMEVYGISASKNFNWSRPFLQQAATNKDTSALTKIFSDLNTDSLKDYQLLRAATLYFNAGEKNSAKRYYEQVISRALARKSQQYDASLDGAYQGIALNIYAGEPELAWGYLQKSIDMVYVPDKFGANNIDNYFIVGEFAVNNNYNVETGLGYLLKYLQLRQNVNDAIHNPYYRVYYKIAEGYHLLKKRDKAREYVQRSLASRNDFQPAKDLMIKLK
ncbi:alpha/beta hydrolase-fold protein [Mucilaginibacter sp. JC4]|uniref:Alpha/beta hydrolase-fold protein n=1 Tax=Mucilaginibacter aquariorum TaxID=2967225 RepID=A0ABT1T7I4_9SPHI|nr:alpha/beta hydrolase-fold protein [Mucilaginibacter aquariorum]